MEIEEAFQHAGKAAHDWQYAEERGRDALPKYMWTEGGKRDRTGYCTHCRIPNIDLSDAAAEPGWVAADPYVDYEDAEHWEMELGLSGPAFPLYWRGENAMDGSARHGHFGRCPHCGMVVQYRNLNRGHQTLRDRAFLIRWEESAVEPGCLVMLGWLVWRNWGEWDDLNAWEPEIHTELREICVFRPGEGGSRFVLVGWTEGDYDAETGRAGNFRTHFRWEHRKKCVGGRDPVPSMFYNQGTRFYLDEDRWLSALDRVPYGGVIKRICADTRTGLLLDRIDPVHFVTKYPCMEYLGKLGLGSLAVAEYDGKRGELLNLRGKTAARVLRVDGDTWGWIKGHKGMCTADFLRFHRLLRRFGVRLGNDVVARIAACWNVPDLVRLLPLLPEGQGAKSVRYLLKRNILPFDYRDYLYQLEQLEMPKTPDALYPADFAAMHQILTARVRIEGDRKTDARIAKRAEKLGAYWFSALGLTLRPFLSSAEIIREGSLMRHCVGGYVNRYADGDTVILCLRRDEQLDQPWHTVEFSAAGRMIQDRGYRNQTEPEDRPLLEQFWRLFELYRADWERQHEKKRKRRAA